jgi:predicted metal-dependent RNase
MIRKQPPSYTYPEYLNSELELIFKEGHNPFLAECFEQVDSAEKRERVITGEPV